MRFDDLEPSWRSGNPALNSRRRRETGAFAQNDPGKNHSFKHARKQIDVLDEDEIVDRTGVGNDHTHGLEAQALQIRDIMIDVFDRDVFKNAVLLKETVDL